MPDMNENAETQQEYFGKVELKSKIVWQDAKDFGKVCTLTESALNGIINEATKELQEVIEKNEYYQNGYRAGSHDEMVKYDTKLFEAEGKVEIRDVRIADLKQQIEKMKCCGNCKHQYEGQYHNGFRCKDHYKEEVCESWELAE